MLNKRKAPHECVMLLMERMGTHPDEFSLTKNSKWGDLFSLIKLRAVDQDKNALIVIEDFEIEMLWSKFKDAGKIQLHAYVMKRILNPEGKENA
jgi:hypothetical protein